MWSVRWLQEGTVSADASAELACDDARAFVSLYQQGLQQGFVYAVFERALPAFAQVQIALLLPDSTSVALRGEVVQVMRMAEGSGMTIQIRQDPNTQKELAAAHERIAALAESEIVEESESIDTEEPFVGEQLSEEEMAALEAEAATEGEVTRRIGDISVLHQLKERGTFERARLAIRADRQERALLTQDAHPQVLKLLLQNPRLSLDEVQSMMRNKHITGEIIQRILKDRRFQGSEDLKMLAVRHPKTPTPLALQLLRQLRQENLRILAKSNALREAIRRQARTLLQSKS